MASTANPRIAPQQIEADIETYLALKVIDNYTPHNARYTLPSAADALARLRAVEEAAIHAHNTLAAARDALLTAQRDFHEIILGAKNEVRALFGPDSDQVASLGLKKKSERSKPKRGAKVTTEG
jgi:hypothetical protein